MKNLKKLFKKFNIDGYIVSKNDEFFNEYTEAKNNRLKLISNFTGSAGFAIILKNKNYLFVDGRYSIQARKQSGKKFNIITVPSQLPKDVIKTKKKIILGYDPKLHTTRQLKRNFLIKNVNLKPIFHENLVDSAYKIKRERTIKPFFTLSKKSSGLKSKNKVNKVIKILKKKKIDYLLVTAPENIAWALNLRGSDIPYSPVTNARLLISKNNKTILFVNPKKVIKLNNINADILSENDLEIQIKNISKKLIWIDTLTCSVFYANLIKEKNKIYENLDPIYFLKSKKNNIELKNIKKSHLFDGIALTKFLFWLKRNFKKKKITEISAQEKLEKFRKKHASYKYPSFDTISGTGPNGAIIHYKASKKTNRTLKTGELYLVDSGGQYLFGTTDVTRTVSLENKSNFIKEIYTRILKGHIAVSNFKIKKRTTGFEVDKKARKFLKEVNLDYPHGTGHGVGYFLNVHEGPQSISKYYKGFLEDGIVMSNEPGFYKEGSFGIRIENLIYLKRNKFHELTLVPIEKSLIKRKMLNKEEINWINNYHYKVFRKLKKFMNPEEKIELLKACSPV